MRPLATLTAIVLTTYVVTSAHGASEAANVDVRGLPGGGTLVLSPTEGAASVAVCVAPSDGMTSGPGSPELAARGGEESTAPVGGVESWCAAAPASELELLLWTAARHVRPKQVGAAPASASTAGDEPRVGQGSVSPAALGRAAAIALEGAELVDASPPAFTVIVAGGAAEERVQAVAGRLFGATTPEATQATGQLRLAQTSERFSELSADRPSPAAVYAYVVPTGDDAAATQVALAILAGDPGARLPRLLTPRMLARRVETWSVPVPVGTLLGLVVEPGPRVSIDRARRFVDGALKQLRIVGPLRRELERARSRLLLSAYSTWEDPLARARLLAEYELARGGATLAFAAVRALGRVTAADISRAVKANLRDGRRTTIEEYPHSFPSDDPRVAHQALYTVAAGDTLTAIAARFHVAVSAIARANDLDPKYALAPGQPLWIPRQTGAD